MNYVSLLQLANNVRGCEFTHLKAQLALKITNYQDKGFQATKGIVLKGVDYFSHLHNDSLQKMIFHLRANIFEPEKQVVSPEKPCK